MTVVDFIDVIDDIIDLSSDEENVQQDCIATQPRATLLDRQAVFVLAGEGRRGVQAAFVSAGEGNQLATEFGNASVATALPSVSEKAPLHMAESQNCSSSPTIPFPSPTSTTLKVLSSEVGHTKQDVFVLADEGRQDAQAAYVSAGEGSQEGTESRNAFVATVSPSVMEKAPLGTAESKNCPSSPTSAPLPSPGSTTPKVLSSEVGHTKQDVFVLAGEGRQDAQAAYVSAGEGSQEGTESGNALVATVSPSVMEKAPLGTAESKNCTSSRTSAPLPSPTSTNLKAVTSEAGDTQLVATASPWVMEKTPLDTAESKNCPSFPASAPLHSRASTTPKALTSEVSDTKPVRVKHCKKNYHVSSPRRSPRFEQKRECCNSPVEQPAADHKRPRMLESAEESAASTDDAESTKTISTESANY